MPPGRRECALFIHIEAIPSDVAGQPDSQASSRIKGRLSTTRSNIRIWFVRLTSQPGYRPIMIGRSALALHDSQRRGRWLVCDDRLIEYFAADTAQIE